MARLCLVLSCGVAWAGENLVAPDWMSGLPRTDPAVWSVERAPGPKGELGVRFTIRRPSEPFHRLQIGQPIAAAVPADHRLALTFRARSSTRNPVRVVVEQSRSPWQASVDVAATIAEAWTDYGSTQTVERAREAGELNVRLQVGHQAGTIEIAALRVEDLGPDPAVAAARAALEPAAVEARIRKHRQAELVVRVTDASGRPVRDAKVTVEQTRHAFLFGCNAFLIDPSSAEPWQPVYRDRFAALLNYATLPFYWGAYESAPGRKNEAKLDAMARWCEERGIAAKGHPLCWHEVWPRWAPKTADESIPLLRGRVEELIPKFKPRIAYWDVWNEANAAVHHPETGIGQWVMRDGPAEPVRQALGWARAASRDGGRVLLYNDFDVSPANERLIATLAASNALPDAIGIQSHMHGGTWSPARVWTVTERFARFGRPLHYTELTVLSGDGKLREGAHHKPGEWPTVPEGEARQAEYVESLYRLLFSHPSVEAITWWDFSDLHAWKGAPAGLVRADMSPKPAYDRLLKLVRGEWWTRAVATADSTGAARFRAFRGAHRITVEAGGKTVTAEAIIPVRGEGATRVTVRSE
jgi:GH35 family endo-1,4-beta-xylanase